DLLDPVDVVPDQRADPADSAPHLFRTDAHQLRGADLRPVTYCGWQSPDLLHAESLQQLCAVERGGGAGVAVGCAGGLRLCALQVPAGRDDCIYAAVVPLRAAAARAAAAVALLSAARSQRHLFRHCLGLSTDRAAFDPVDRAR